MTANNVAEHRRLSPLLELMIDVVVTVPQSLHLLVLTADVRTVLIEASLQGAARLLRQLQVPTQFRQLGLFGCDVPTELLFDGRKNKTQNCVPL